MPSASRVSARGRGEPPNRMGGCALTDKCDAADPRWRINPWGARSTGVYAITDHASLEAGLTASTGLLRPPCRRPKRRASGAGDRALIPPGGLNAALAGHARVQRDPRRRPLQCLHIMRLAEPRRTMMHFQAPM